jgi:hypothetical protein
MTPDELTTVTTSAVAPSGVATCSHEERFAARGGPFRQNEQVHARNERPAA